MWNIFWIRNWGHILDVHSDFQSACELSIHMQAHERWRPSMLHCFELRCTVHQLHIWIHIFTWVVGHEHLVCMCLELNWCFSKFTGNCLTDVKINDPFSQVLNTLTVKVSGAVYYHWKSGWSVNCLWLLHITIQEHKGKQKNTSCSIHYTLQEGQPCLILCHIYFGEDADPEAKSRMGGEWGTIEAEKGKK